MQVKIIYINETNKSVWNVEILETGELLDSFITLQKAENYCKENKYEIKSWGKRGIPDRY